MNLIVVAPPAAEPVTLAEARMALRLTATESNEPPDHPHDAMITRHIATARRQAEQYTHRSFVEQTLQIYTNRFPCGETFYCGEYWRPYRGRGYIELLRPPLIGVTSVEYYDDENEIQTIDVANYFVTNDLVPRLHFIDGFYAPQCYARADAVRVNYVAGYPPEGSPAEDWAANVPSEFKDAILIGVQLLYNPLTPQEREALEKARDSLLDGLVVHTLV